VQNDEQHAQRLAQIPEFATFGALHKSSRSVALTEEETEYRVEVVKHVFKAHMVLEFSVTNTMADQLLEKTSVKLDLPDGFAVVKAMPIASLPANKPGTVFIALRIPDDLSQSTCV
jgi:coatomer subunit gamma